MAGPSNSTWIADARRLRNWFWAYFLLLGIGLYTGITTAASLDVFGVVQWITGDVNLRLSWGGSVLLASLLPYVMSIVYSYRVQKQLHASGLYRHSAFDIVFGAIVLNPFFLGWYIPASVLWTVRRVRRKLQAPPSASE